MLDRMTDMLGFSATAGDKSFPVREIFFDRGDGSVKYLALDIGGWFDTTEVLVSTGLMGTPDPDSRTWPADISPETVAEAPEWSGGRNEMMFADGSWPMLMAGPVGSFGIDLRMVEIMAREAEPKEGDGRVVDLDRVTRWIGLAAFGTDGELGTVDDLFHDRETGRITHLVIDTGTFLSGKKAVVPLDRVRHRVKEDSHLVLNLTSGQLDNAPPVEDDEMDGTLLDSLRSYYQVLPVL